MKAVNAETSNETNNRRIEEAKKETTTKSRQNTNRKTETKK